MVGNTIFHRMCYLICDTQKSGLQLLKFECNHNTKSSSWWSSRSPMRLRSRTRVATLRFHNALSFENRPRSRTRVTTLRFQSALRLHAPSRALHLCTAWHAITLYLLRFSVTMSRIYSPMCLSKYAPEVC